MMIAKDEQGRPLMNTPKEALQHLSSIYDVHRFQATLSFSRQKQVIALGELEHTLSETRRAVAGTRDAGLDSLATHWRAVQEFVQALRDEMHMWILLGEARFHAAWDVLVAAQSAAHWAARYLPNFEPAQHLEEHLSKVECVVFPKQQFLSPSMIIDMADVECSLCHVRGGECNHIAGDIYAGQVAHRIIHDVKGIREISFVDNPASKRARALYYDNMDLLTGESENGSRGGSMSK